MDKDKAVTVVARTHAKLIDAMLIKGEASHQCKAELLLGTHCKRVLRSLTEWAKMLGMQIISAPHPA